MRFGKLGLWSISLAKSEKWKVPLTVLDKKNPTENIFKENESILLWYNNRVNQPIQMCTGYRSIISWNSLCFALTLK